MSSHQSGSELTAQQAGVAGGVNGYVQVISRQIEMQEVRDGVRRLFAEGKCLAHVPEPPR